MTGRKTPGEDSVPASRAEGVAEPSPSVSPTSVPDSVPQQGGEEEKLEAELKDLVAGLERERDEYLELARRTKADFENYRKRVDREAAQAAARGRAALASRSALGGRQPRAGAGGGFAAQRRRGRQPHCRGDSAGLRGAFRGARQCRRGELLAHRGAVRSRPARSDAGPARQPRRDPRGLSEGIPPERAGAPSRACRGRCARSHKWRTSTTRWASRKGPPRRRSRRPTASLRASTTRTRIPATTSAEERFKQIQEAYSVLSDAEKRKQYDAGGMLGGGGLSLRPFGVPHERRLLRRHHLRSVRARRRRRDRPPGASADAISRPRYACRSGRRSTAPRSPSTCRSRPTAPPATARAPSPGRARRPVPSCGGRGIETEGQGMFSIAQPCSVCGGRGIVIDDPCPTCRGAGRTQQTKRYRVKVPAGVREGSRIKLAGKGEPGMGGGPAGDLYVVTHVAPSPIYKRKGDNVEVDVPITIVEAVTGGTVEVPTLDGTKKIRVPAGTKDGSVQRLRGEGPEKLSGTRARRHPLSVPHRGPDVAHRGAARGRRAALEGDERQPARGPPGPCPQGELMASKDDLFADDQGVFMISVAAELAGMHPQTLRIYESRGLIKPKRSPKQTRLYSQRDVERLRRIQELTTEVGLNLAGVERVLELERAMDTMQRELDRDARPGRAAGARDAPADPGGPPLLQARDGPVGAPRRTAANQRLRARPQAPRTHPSRETQPCNLTSSRSSPRRRFRPRSGSRTSAAIRRSRPSTCSRCCSSRRAGSSRRCSASWARRSIRCAPS